LWSDPKDGRWRHPGSFEVAAFQVVTEIAEKPSAAESIGWPMKYRLPALS
jgi:hypothetical protein